MELVSHDVCRCDHHAEEGLHCSVCVATQRGAVSELCVCSNNQALQGQRNKTN